MTLILASNSATRRAMLNQCGIAYRAIPAALDERAIEADMAGAPPSEIALTLAVAKARQVAAQHSEALVLGSDSLVTVGGRRFDKPRDRDDAANHLRYFSGKTIALWSAAALVRGGAVVERLADKAELVVRELSEGFIADYISAEWPAIGHCVGAFRIEARGPLLFEDVRGDHFTILGMPLLKVLAALRRQGAIAI